MIWSNTNIGDGLREFMYEDRGQWKAQNKALTFSCMFSLNHNEIKSSLIFFLTPKTGFSDIPPLHEERNALFIRFEVAYGVRVKIWVTSRGSIMKKVLTELKIIVWHKWKKNASFHFALNVLFHSRKIVAFCENYFCHNLKTNKVYKNIHF